MNNLKSLFIVFKFCSLILFFLGSTTASAQWILINQNGGNPDSSAALEIQSNEHGILIPRLSQAERDAISNPAKGLLLYQTDQDSGFYFYNGSLWQQIASSAQLDENDTDELQTLSISNDSLSISNGNSVSLSGNTTPWNDSANSINTTRTVGIGTLTPDTNASLNLAQKPFLPPRLSNAQMLAVPNPSDGMVVFNSSLGCPCYYFAERWENGCGTNGFQNIDVNTVSSPLRGDISASAAGGDTTVQSQAIAVDNSGNTYITGNFQGTATFGNDSFTSNGSSSNDLFVSKLDPNGNFLWTVSAGGIGFESGNGIAVDASGNVYVTGSFQNLATFGNTTLSSDGSDVFVSKLDPNGNFLWTVQAGANGTDIGIDIAVDGSSNVYVTGSFENSVTFGGTPTIEADGGFDIFVSKLDSNGTFLWAAQAGGGSTDQGRGIAVDASGNTYVTGLFINNANFGDDSLPGEGSRDVFVSKLDPNGNFLWAVQAGGASLDQGIDIAVDNSGNAYITGSFQSAPANFGNTMLSRNGTSGSDVFVSKLDPSGNFLWARQVGETSADEGNGIALDNSGNAYITGRFSDVVTFGNDTLSSNGSEDVFVSKLDPSGNFLWARQAGGNGADRGNGIAVDTSSNAYSTGNFEGTATFGIDNLTSSGSSDVFIMRILSTGVF